MYVVYALCHDIFSMAPINTTHVSNTYISSRIYHRGQGVEHFSGLEIDINTQSSHVFLMKLS